MEEWKPVPEYEGIYEVSNLGRVRRIANINKNNEIIKLRKEKGFTQEQMARLLKVTRATYANYETGYRSPNLRSIMEMKKVLGTEDDKIFLQDNDTISN